MSDLPSIPPFDEDRRYFSKDWTSFFAYVLKELKRLSLKPSSGGVSDHTLLTEIGTSTHPQLDTERTSSIAHRADNTSHIVHPANTPITYNGDGTVNVVSNSFGTKTMVYSGGKLTNITGTGIYKQKAFTYNGSDQLTNIAIT